MAKTQYNIKRRDPEGEIHHDTVMAYDCEITRTGCLVFRGPDRAVILAYSSNEWVTVVDGW